MTDRQSLPRFIQTQAGSWLSLAHITVMGRKTTEDGSVRVCADILPQRGFVLGVYDTDADARTALNMIIGQIGSGQQFISAPCRDFRTMEVGE